MKKIILIALVTFLVGCEAETVDVSHEYQIPDELADCIFKRMNSSTGKLITVVRCPNSTTSTIKSDKAHTTTIVVDGVKYTSTK